VHTRTCTGSDAQPASQSVRVWCCAAARKHVP
jgi:hypothetical protein